MTDPRITIVVAMARDRVIGEDGGMPWHLPADLQHAKRLTMGKPLVMGRRTHESIGRALPGRTNIVLSRDPDYRSEGVHVVPDLGSALALAREVAQADGAEEIIIFGGAQIYRMALPMVSRIHLTEVHLDVEGDTRFPKLTPEEWREVTREEHAADGDRPAHAFVTLERW